MMIDVAQAKYAVDKIVGELASHVRRNDDGSQYVENVDYDALATLALLASRATGYDVDGDEIATLFDDYSTGNCVQSILDQYAG